MKNNNKNENKICFILHTITSLLFMLSGITNLINSGISNWMGITGIALSITFGALAVMYYKKYKEEK